MLERQLNSGDFIDVLDRVLDKGVVIDSCMRISIAGIHLMTIEAHVVMASMDTDLKYASAFRAAAPLTRH